MDIKLKSLFEKCLGITGLFEGASWGGIAGNFDGMGLSAFIIQWNIGQGTLQKLLMDMYSPDPQKFDAIAKDKSADIIKMALAYDREVVQEFINKVTEGKQFNPAQWSNKFYKGGLSIKPEWKAIFKEIGEAYKDVQLTHAQTYFDGAIALCKDFSLETERSVVFMFDQAVQRGKASLADEYQQYKKERPEFITEKGLLNYILENDLPDFNQKYREDVQSRRKCILDGQGIVHGAKRDLVKEFGLSDTIVLPVS